MLFTSCWNCKKENEFIGINGIILRNTRSGLIERIDPSSNASVHFGYNLKIFDFDESVNIIIPGIIGIMIIMFTLLKSYWPLYPK